MARYRRNSPGYTLLYTPRDNVRAIAVKDPEEATRILDAAPQVRTAILLLGVAPYCILETWSKRTYEIVQFWQAGEKTTTTYQTGQPPVTRTLFDASLVMGCKAVTPGEGPDAMFVSVHAVPGGHMQFGVEPLDEGEFRRGPHPKGLLGPVSKDGAACILAIMLNNAFPRGASMPKRWGMDP